MKYLGYEIKRKADGQYGVYRSGHLVISRESENSCTLWIDEHKKALARDRDLKRNK